MRLRAVLVIVLTLWGSGLSVAWGQECRSKPVRAKGGYGLLEATAKSRARSAWIKKVRGKRRLGKEFAAWLRARDASYVCQRSGKRIACVASAMPCRVKLEATK